MFGGGTEVSASQPKEAARHPRLGPRQPPSLANSRFHKRGRSFINWSSFVM